MASDRLIIDFAPLGRRDGNEVARAFLSEITMTAGDVVLTRVEDLLARTTRDHIRGCAHHLAVWLASNWWRLRWEPAPNSWESDPDWRMAHTVASAGGGYVWPPTRFVTDGEFVEVWNAPNDGAPFEPIRYINRAHVRISAGAFEAGVDRFMEGVLARGRALAMAESELDALWSEVMAERHGPEEIRRYRKLEAMAGYDPDAAPQELITELLADTERLGQDALEEIAADARHLTAQALEPIRRLAASVARPADGGVRATMPKFSRVQHETNADAAPWERGAGLARLARREWGLGDIPVSDATLAGLLGVRPSVFSDKAIVETPIPFSVQQQASGTADLYLNRANPSSRRFAVTRLLGDHLLTASQDRVIPATRARTSRQQAQRAFAQEFLCPLKSLLDRLGTTNPDDEDISDAAAHFGVSPLLVRTTLVNNHMLGREALDRV